MRVSGTAALALIVIMVATLSGGTLAQSAPKGQAGAPIRLKAVTFNPSAGESAGAPINLVRRAAPAEGHGYYIVQAPRPVDQAWKDSLAALGVELLGYIPENAFKVRMSAEQAARLRQLGITSYVGLFHPFYALSPQIVAAGQQIVTVHLEQGGNMAAVEGTVAAAGATLVAGEGDRLIVAGDRRQIQSVAQAMDVAWIEPLVLNEKHNEVGGGAIIGGATANASGYDGSTQIAAVADTGIGGGTAATAHRDIAAADVVAIQNFPGVTDSCFQQIVNDGAVDVDSGHGSHVAGSVLSRGDPGGAGRGVAPAARLVFQAIENYVVTSSLCKTLYGYQNDYYLTGLNNLSTVFQQAYNAGARIHANSWGAPVAGDYNANSVTTDQFIWNNRDMTITFSAGNSGVDANNNGVVDNDSIGSPATAKNVITIGASENQRPNYACDTGLAYTSNDTTYQSGQTCGSMGGNNLLGTAGQRWGFTTEPLYSDPSAGNAQQMAPFSSRGPTDDGRIKPDVVAPGTWILSWYSNSYQQGYDPSTNPQNGAYQSDGWGMPRDAYYKYFGGTSMANPIAAGAATVVRDFYQKAHSHSASAALVKATLINSAVDLLDENNDGANDNDFPIPNVHEGWGRIDLSAATDGSAIYTDNTAGLGTGGAYSATYSAAGGPLKVTLVWSDYPSTAAAAVNLVNNLNLTVTGPGGVLYRGNVFSGGSSASGGSADTLNNVENIFIQSPAAGGSYTVQVSGANVPQGPQPFALVVRGAQAAPPPTPPAAPSGLTASAASSSQINLSWSDNSTNEDGFTIERCQGAGCSSFSQIASVGAGVTSYPNSGLSASTSYSYRVRAYNAGGSSAYSNTASATTLAGATNTGLLSPAANAAQTSSAGDNNGYQTSPANAHGDDGLFAVDTNSGTGNQTSCTNNRKDKHLYRDYNIAVPGGATINGIEVRLDARADATAGAPRICVQLSWNGGASWTSALQSGTLTTSEATYTLGGAANTWGRSWGSADLSNANFRVRVINVASNTSRDFSLDWVAVRVTYQ